MNAPTNLKEAPLRSRIRTIYTHDEIGIPGLNLFGHFLVSSATEPIILHYHEHVLEFTIAVKGDLVWHVNDTDYHFHGGDVFICYPDEVHSGNNNPFTISEIFWFQLDLTEEDNFLFLCPEAAQRMISQFKQLSGHIIHTDSAVTHPLFKHSYNLLETDGDRFILAAHMLLLLQHLIATSSATDEGTTPDIDAALNYIDSNITIDFSLEELAKISNLSSSHFQQKFKKQVGIGPRHYINHKKIEYSKQLLLKGYSITDVAMIMGYNTSGYFSTVFKKYALYTPSEFLKLEKQKENELDQDV